MSLLDPLINYFLKSDYVKAQILGFVRASAAALGAALVTHGLATDNMSQDLIGLVMTFAGYYLTHLDVRLVDGKIKVALDTVPGDVTGETIKTSVVEVHNLPNIETKK